MMRIEKYIIIPFWMAGDHYIVAWGSVNGKPYLLCIDTGLAGGGFTCPESTIRETGIKLLDHLTGEGIGGGGKVKVIPFIVNRLFLGETEEKNIRGLFSGVFPIENVFGFRIGGIISHQFFRNYSLTLDFINMKLYLKRFV